jgi:hypothetical protein
MLLYVADQQKDKRKGKDMADIWTIGGTVAGVIGAAATIGGFWVAYLTVVQGFKKAEEDRRAALVQAQKELEQSEKELRQAQRDLLWRQTVEAQAAIRRMAADPQARDAMTMLDWNGRSFLIREGWPREHITWEEMRHALRAYPDRFAPKEVFVRDCFDAFFDHLQMIEQQIQNRMFELQHVHYPIGYYSNRMNHPYNWPAIEQFLEKYDFPLALQLITDTRDMRAQPIAKSRSRNLLSQVNRL